MKKFTPGQRWVSHTEPEIGLGTLTHADRRTIKIRFDAGMCTRMYTFAAAPIKRVRFNKGDTVRLKDGSDKTIVSAEEKEGLFYYTAEDSKFCETELSSSLLVARPQERLFAGLTDPLKLFNLRYNVLKAKANYDALPFKGFLGGQVELLPHQLYIADTVSNRFIPRVLLSDETGLGKTIEACLIIHKLLISHKISRVLIIMPPALLHQWFIELYRKFNLSFMILSDDYCITIEQSQEGINPFLQSQLGIVSLELLENEKRRKQILSAGWDMLVIDEAHHITDDERIFSHIRHLASLTDGLLLLTATPEQMGQKNHFRHLQLIDPDKYFDYDIFCAESNGYEKAVSMIKNKGIDDPLFEHLLDTYGPGRIIFKNKRSVIKGFPKRICTLFPLKADQAIVNSVNREIMSESSNDSPLEPNDPRVLCLLKQIRKNEKILVITRTKEMANAIETAIAEHINTPTARFDEGMTLMQRDRHAAFFAQPDGAQVLICSEIGSEGRNFQFVSDLFLFDLPTHPELLEQRIGRLDRIGQKNDIHIWIPYVKNSGHEILARWYMDGIGIFEHHVDGVAFIFSRFKNRLFKLAADSAKAVQIDRAALDRLISDTRKLCQNVKKKRDRGQNLLLEFNSFKPKTAEQIIDQVTLTDNDKTLARLLSRVWDHYGIETDFFAPKIFSLSSDTITDEAFPMPAPLPSAMTFDRSEAVVRDELDFITWDHAFVHDTFEYFVTNLTGTCATARMKDQDSPGLLLETVYSVECVAPVHLNMEQYLNLSPIRIVVDHHGNQVADDEEFTAFSEKLLPDNPAWFKDMAQISQQVIPAMIKSADKISQITLTKAIKDGQERIKRILGHEIDRLNSLKKINPGIRNKEILLAEARMEEQLAHVSNTQPKLDSLRLIRVET